MCFPRFYCKRLIAFAASIMMPASLLALPSTADFSHIGGIADSANYTINNANESTLNLTADRQVVHFSGGGFNLSASEVFNASYTGSNVSQAPSVLIKDVSENPSAIFGKLNGNMQVFLINQNGVLFGNGSSVDLPGLVVSSLDLSAPDFEAGNFNFIHNGLSSGITIEGLTSVNDVSFISDTVTIDGEVNVTNGGFHAVAGENVVVTYDSNNLIQFDITEAIDANDPDGVIHVTANGQIIAQDVNLRARVLDPYSLAINNQGLIRATGLDTSSTPGVIRLIGQGGTVLSKGEIDAGDGEIEIMAGTINLASQLIAGTSNFTIGFGTNFGLLDVFEINKLQTQSLNINGLGQVNMVLGLANIEVNGLNEGTAGLEGVGVSADNWTENAVTFSNVHHFTLTGEVSNSVNVTADGQLFTQFNGVDVGHIISGGNDDIFTVDGDIVFLDGGHGDDVLNGVFNPNSGTSDNVLSWGNIEAVFPAIIQPEPPEFKMPVNINVPGSVSTGLNDNSSSSLGLVSTDQSLKLPCAYRDKDEAKDDDDCAETDLEVLASSLIHFDFDSSAITLASQDRLNRVASFILQEDRFDRVVLSGHADNVGTIAYNLVLSARRTTSTADYLKGQGIAPSVFETHAFGESLPAKSNVTDAGRAYNRRVHVELE